MKSTWFAGKRRPVEASRTLLSHWPPRNLVSRWMDVSGCEKIFFVAGGPAFLAFFGGIQGVPALWHTACISSFCRE